MATFDLTHEVDPNEEGVLSTSPGWVLCVIRFKTLSTFSRSNMASMSTDGSVAADEKGDPLIISSDCISVVTNSNKRGHTGSLNASLKIVDVDYLSEIMPGDWIFCWINEYEEHTLEVIDKIKNRKAANGFHDGLKFMGRVFSVHETMVTDERGNKTMGVDVQGVSFNEFDTGCYYNPYLATAQQFVNTWMANLGLAVDKFLGKDELDINVAMPELVELLFGRGISQKAANPAGEPELQGITGLTTGDGEAPFSYVVPATVGTLLGKTSRSKSSGVLAYADILQSIMGVQKYNNNAVTGPSSASTFDNQIAGFSPSQLKPMMGKFVPIISPFSGQPVWNVLHQYLNPAVNEMYTCLRADENGNVLPTLVVRQLPFTSSVMANDNRTAFLELPRWKAPMSMITKYRIGRSDALRCNFVQMMGEAPAEAQPDVFTFQAVRNPAIRDDQDIRRSGLRPDIQQVACGITDQQVGPEEWNKVRADILMGQHLTLGGSLNMFGVEAPICEGDNFEFKNTVLHIESVTHTAAIIDSKKQFMTTLQLSSGIRSDSQGTPAAPPQAFGDDKIYAALQPEDMAEEKPGIGAVGQDEASAQRNPGGSGPGDFFSSEGGGLA